VTPPDASGLRRSPKPASDSSLRLNCRTVLAMLCRPPTETWVGALDLPDGGEFAAAGSPMLETATGWVRWVAVVAMISASA
jgi:hypothetical protein